MGSYATYIEEKEKSGAEHGPESFRNFKACKTVHGQLSGVAHKDSGRENVTAAVALRRQLRSQFAQEILLGADGQGNNIFSKIIESLTQAPQWGAALSQANNNIGIEAEQKDMAMTAMSNVANKKNLDLTGIEATDSPELAAAKLATNNPEIFAIHPETQQPLKADELAQSCATPQDIISMCNGQGFSQDHAMLMIEAIHSNNELAKSEAEMSAQKVFAPKVANELAAPAPAA